jgi:hypothetical protein
MNPSFLFELYHNRINKWVSCSSISPSLEVFIVFIPFYLFAYGIPFYFVEVGSKSTIEIEELSPY